jgi:hypothetical protein
MVAKKMPSKVRDLLKLVPDEILESIGKDVGVDYHNQKLTGSRIFKVLLFSLSETTRISLRVIEKVYNSVLFQQHVGDDAHQRSRHSSFAERLSKINYEYFERIFTYLSTTYQDRFTAHAQYNHLYRFDSTFMGLSKTLFSHGLNCGGSPNLLFTKIVIGQKGLIPHLVRFCRDKSEVADDIAFKKAISDAVIDKEDIVIFDRGLKSGKILTELDEKNVTFITRTKVGRLVKIVETFTHSANQRTESAIVLDDQKVKLVDRQVKHDGTKYFTRPLRLITIQSDKTKELICFLTNDFNLEATEIANLYQRRWDIEVFFRFIKQELNLKHFLARNNNGIKVYIYMVLILSILLLIYKTANNLSGFKFVKWDFFHELEVEIMTDIISLCGGNPEIFLKQYGLS